MLAGAGAVTAASAAGQTVTWEAWSHQAGVFDIGGPRSDGKLVLAAAGGLFLADSAGQVTPFAQGAGGYRAGAPLSEAYLAVSPGLHDSGSGCDFTKDDVFVLQLSGPVGVVRVSADGHAALFATVSNADSLNGIVFDQTGRFGHQLLVTGPRHGRSVVDAIDCRGHVTLVTDAAPTLEGGLAIAPAGFGAYAGDLVAPDELSGRLLAISPGGTSEVIAESGLPHGGDIGVEGVEFVPPDFLAGGSVYFADRATPGNPHPGTDTVLRLAAANLKAEGVREGDLLAASEGGALMVAVHCGNGCTVTRVVDAPSVAHGEGHLVFVADHPAGPTPGLAAVKDLGGAARQQRYAEWAGLALVGVAVAGVFLLSMRRRVRRP